MLSVREKSGACWNWTAQEISRPASNKIDAASSQSDAANVRNGRCVQEFHSFIIIIIYYVHKVVWYDHPDLEDEHVKLLVVVVVAALPNLHAVVRVVRVDVQAQVGVRRVLDLAVWR